MTIHNYSGRTQGEGALGPQHPSIHAHTAWHTHIQAHTTRAVLVHSTRVCTVLVHSTRTYTYTHTTRAVRTPHAHTGRARRPAWPRTECSLNAWQPRAEVWVGGPHSLQQLAVPPPLREAPGRETFPEGLCMLQPAHGLTGHVMGAESHCTPGLARPPDLWPSLPGLGPVCGHRGSGRRGEVGGGMGTHGPVSPLLPAARPPETSPGCPGPRKAWKGGRARASRPQPPGPLNSDLRQWTLQVCTAQPSTSEDLWGGGGGASSQWDSCPLPRTLWPLSTGPASLGRRGWCVCFCGSAPAYTDPSPARVTSPHAFLYRLGTEGR